MNDSKCSIAHSTSLKRDIESKTKGQTRNISIQQDKNILTIKARKINEWDELVFKYLLGMMRCNDLKVEITSLVDNSFVTYIITFK